MIPPKINVACIVRGQLGTLGGSWWATLVDIFTFLLLPIGAGVAVVVFGIDLDADTYGFALTVFSIFSALLITVQIAIYGIYSKQRDHIAFLDAKGDSDKSIGESILINRYEKRAEKFALLNANISYLTLLSCVCASVFLLFVAFDFPDSFEKFASVFVYVHFFFSLVMVLKRFHIIFEGEYTA
ncbi:hypothetical protein J7399_08400 [Shimia sp. R9_1]|uniref:hypothetical protein n=1 Tax=Shimia sp. R9_1 TaxID=2821111 RepID=UPI001ADC6ECF|nr:hypothetical protein [Shimia sp. R9_1]MBO9407443.1 hypothetical protein [Shimia sp. R9_1]